MDQNFSSEHLERSRAGLSLSMAVFFLCGFSTVLNIILIPHLQHELHLRYTSMALVPISFYLAYFLFSPLAGHIFQRRTYLEGIRWGLFVGSLGILGLSFASMLMWYPLFLFGEFILGAGIAVLQVTANPYTMLLGSKETASSRLTLVQAFTSIGTVLAPYFGSVFMLAILNPLNVFGYQLRGPSLYLFLTLAWIGVLLFTYLSQLPEGVEGVGRTQAAEKNDFSPLKERFVILGIIGIGMATGVEVTISSYLAKFLAEEEMMAVSLTLAGKFTIIFWVGFLVGRLFGSRLLQKMTAERLLMRHALLGVVFTLGTVFFSGYVAVFCVLALGLCISVMFPVIFSLVLRGCRSREGVVSGFLCMANIGGALLPLLQGLLADRFGVHRSYILPLVAFLYIAFYANYLKSRAAAMKFNIAEEFGL